MRLPVLSEPRGIRIHDPRTDELRERDRWVVVDDDGSLRTLHLRVARGRLVDDEGRSAA